MIEFIKQCAEVCGFTYEEIIGESRCDKISVSRQVIWLELRQRDLTYEAIASAFGRTHSAIVKGVQRAKGLIYVGHSYAMNQFENIKLFQIQEEIQI